MNKYLMRLLELIEPVQEIEAIPGTGYEERGMDDDIQQGMPHSHQAKKWRGLRYYIDKNAGMLYTYSPDLQTVTGRLNFVDPFYTATPGVRIKNVYVHKKYRGEGVGSSMYDIMLNKFKIIRSDDIQTSLGQRMWVSLHNKPGVTVRAVLYIYPEFITDQIKRELAKLNAIEKPKNKNKKAVYEIPVDTTESMRRLTVNSRLLGIYNIKQDMGLVAYKDKGAGSATR